MRPTQRTTILPANCTTIAKAGVEKVGAIAVQSLAVASLHGVLFDDETRRHQWPVL